MSRLDVHMEHPRLIFGGITIVVVVVVLIVVALTQV